MVSISSEQKVAFLNALQLSIASSIKEITYNENLINIYFDAISKKDLGLACFKKIIHVLRETSHSISIEKLNSEKLELLTSFLLLSRLKEENVKKLIKKDVRYHLFLDVVDFNEKGEVEIQSIQESSNYIFQIVAKRKMILRELSESTGLTAMTLNNFKLGKNIRLDNFLKLTRALNIQVILKHEEKSK